MVAHIGDLQGEPERQLPLDREMISLNIRSLEVLRLVAGLGLTFDPKTLMKKPLQSADITATTVPGDSEDEPVETGFSLGD